MKITIFLNSKKTAKLLSYLAIIGGVFLFIMFGVLQWPGLHWDAALYATPIINLATDNGWKFDAYTPVLINRESQEYSFHGLLTPIIFGIIIKTSTYESLLLWCSIFNAITFIVYTFLFHRALNKKFPIWSLLIATIFGAMAGLICQELQGRPEHLATLFMAIPLLMRSFPITHKWARYCSYTMPGLLFILSPLLGVIYGMGLLFWLGLNDKQTLWKELLLVCLLSLGISGLIITIFCSFSPWQWIINTFLAGNSQLLIAHLRYLITFRVSLTTTPFWSFFVIIIAFLVLKNIWKRRDVITLIIWIILGLYIWLKAYDYNYFSFFPLLLIMVLENKQNWLTESEQRKNKFIYFGITFASFYVLTLIRWTLLLIIYWQQGISLNEAKVNYFQLTRKINFPKERVSFLWLTRPSLIIFGRAVNNELITVDMSSINENEKLDTKLIKYEQKFKERIVYLVVPQPYYLNTPPSALNDGEFKLVYNGWIKKPATFMGIKLGVAVPGYQFALYKRAK